MTTKNRILSPNVPLSSLTECHFRPHKNREFSPQESIRRFYAILAHPPTYKKKAPEAFSYHTETKQVLTYARRKRVVQP